jgi:hypothetical protein
MPALAFAYQDSIFSKAYTGEDERLAEEQR